MMTGFIGLGVMGKPMARNLLRAGVPLTVWNRSIEKGESLRDENAALVAACADDVFAQADVVILMLADETAINDVLHRATDAFASLVAGRTIVHMGTTSAQFSAGLDADIRRAGGRYVEAPVSGSRKPAEAGDLIAMVAGDDDAVLQVLPLLQPMCRDAIRCGTAPNATRMKLAVNLFLITMVTGLVEAANFARAHDLDLNAFRAVLDAGPMASNVSRAKLAKAIDRDFSVQAAIFDVLKNARLIAEAARCAHVASPLLDESYALFQETFDLGFAHDDMAAVIRAIETRTNLLRA